MGRVIHWLAYGVIVMLFSGIPLVAQAGIADEAEAMAKQVPKRIYATGGESAWSRSGLRSFDALVRELAGADVVFLGEQHDDLATHRLQLELLQALDQARFSSVTLAMEQFERDVQAVLDDYLAGRIDEEQFLADSRPWPNYERDYRPLVEYCRAGGLPVIAGNIPRPLASRIAKEGFEAAWAGFTDEERTWTAHQTTHPKDDYWGLFQMAMGGHGEGAMDEAMVESFYAAQCIKDDTMAESIQLQLVSRPYRQVIHTNGSFHSDYGLGTAARVRWRLPEARVVVIAIRPVASWQECDPLAEALPGAAAVLQEGGVEHHGAPLGDYVIFVPGPDFAGDEVVNYPPPSEEPAEELAMPMPSKQEDGGEGGKPAMPMPPPEKDKSE